MKDIDFDELDRAVSSVLGQKVSDNNKDESSSGQVSSEADVNKNSPVISDDANLPEVKNQSQPKVRPVRRGKFMDMVQPSAGTQKPKAKPFPTRSAPQIQPLSDNNSLDNDSSENRTDTQVPEVAHVEIPEISPDLTTIVSESTQLIGSETLTGNDEPPLPDTSLRVNENQNEIESVADKNEDLSDNSDTVNLTETASNDEDPEASEADTAEVTTEPPREVAVVPPIETMVPATPFLADTKVEKRPLGGLPDADDSVATEKTADSKDLQLSPDIPLPRELQSDVIEVESPKDETMNSTQSAPFATNITAAAEPHDDDRVEGHPVFDTSAYHEPIIAVHESTVPSWLKWLLGLALCLVLGAGVGYFLFTAGL